MPATHNVFYATAQRGAETTPLVEVAACTTNRACDVDRSGLATALDHTCIRAAILQEPPVLVWPCDVDDSGSVDETDLVITQDAILGR